MIALSLVGCLQDLPDLADPCAPFPDPGLFRTDVERPDSRTRHPYVYVPGGEGPRDLVVLLHGAGMNGPDMASLSGFLPLADRDGFVVVYPNGLGWPLKEWDAGPAYGGADDVGFLDATVDAIAPKVCGGHVFAVGFSNGAMMAQRWACQGKTVEAVGASSGPLLVPCDRDPLPIRYYQGTGDEIVPEAGGSTPRGIPLPSTEESMASWRETNRCTADPPAVDVHGDTTCSTWTCDAPTTECLVDGWTHMWPGGDNSDRTDADATGEIWSFFQSVGGSDPIPPGGPSPSSR